MQKHFPGKKVEEYRRMLGLFGVSGDLALQQVNTFLLYTQKCCSEICKKGKKNPFCSFLSNHWYIHFPQDGYKIKILVKFFKNVDFGILRKSYEFLKWHFFPISKHHARFFMYYYCISIRSLLVNEISQCLIWLHRYLLKKCIK